MATALKLLHRTKIPTGDPASICWGDKGIWVADVERRTLLLMDARTGKVLKSLDSIVRRPQTITWDGAEVWEYDEETSDLYRQRLSDGRRTIYGKVSGVNIPYLGMAYRDKTMWLLQPDQPYFTVSNNLITVVKFPRRIQFDTFEAPNYSCRGLCHDGRYLWTLDVEASELFCLDPDTGSIITSYELKDVATPSSLVVTDDRFWTIDLRKNELLTYALDRKVQHSTGGGRRSSVDIVYTLRNNGPSIIDELEFSQCLPQDYVHQRVLGPVRVSPEPDERLQGQWNEGKGTVVVHKATSLAPGREHEVTVSLDVETVDLKYHVYPHLVGGLDDIPDKIRRAYLFKEMLKSKDRELVEIVKMSQTLFQTEHKDVRSKVEEILDGERNPFWMAKKIYDWVVDTVKYILPYSSISSRKILKQGKGSCGNHATIYIAMCEAAGLPARSIIGYGVWKVDSRLGYLDHEIPEVYLPRYGWIPADTSRFMSLPIRGSHPLTKFRSFGTLSDRMFVNGFGRDMTSPFARRRYNEERLTVVEGECRPEELFFMRWKSEKVPTWKD